MTTPALLILLVASGSGKAPAKSDFSMPALPDLPKADNLQTSDDQAPKLDTPTADVPSRQYEVVKVIHAQSFESHGDSYTPRKAVSGFDVVNLPMVLPAFSSLVRVKSPQKVGAPIELSVRDPQGNAMLSSAGTLVFGGQTTTDYVVDWAPIKIERAGDYVVEVKVDGKVLSKSPLPIHKELRASLTETQPSHPALKSELVATPPSTTTGSQKEPAPDPYDVTR